MEGARDDDEGGPAALSGHLEAEEGILPRRRGRLLIEPPGGSQ